MTAGSLDLKRSHRAVAETALYTLDFNSSLARTLG
jgi:hypothetical protein